MAEYILKSIDKRDNVVISVPGYGDVSDPYYWLELHQTKEHANFCDESTNLFNIFLQNNKNDKFDEKVENFIKKLYNCPKTGIGLRRIRKWCIMEVNSGEDEANILVKFRDLYDLDVSKRQILLNVNTNDYRRNKKNATATLVTYSFSPEGLYVAYAVSENGKEALIIRVRKINTNEELKDECIGIITKIEWYKNCTGFFYCNYADRNIWKEHSIYFHRLGTNSKDDLRITNFPAIDNTYFIVKNFYVSHCGRYLIYSIGQNHKNTHNLYYIRLHRTGKFNSKSEFKSIQIVKKWDACYEYITNYGYSALFLTNKKAPRNHIILISLKNVKPKCHCNWRIIIPEDKYRLLEAVYAVANKTYLILKYLHDVKSEIEIYNVKLGVLARRFNFERSYITEVNASWRDFNVFLRFQAPLDPGTVRRYQFKKTANDKGGWWLPWFLKRNKIKRNKGGGDNTRMAGGQEDNVYLNDESECESEEFSSISTEEYDYDIEQNYYDYDDVHDVHHNSHDDDNVHDSSNEIRFRGGETNMGPKGAAIRIQRKLVNENQNNETISNNVLIDELDTNVPIYQILKRPNPSIVFSDYCSYDFTTHHMSQIFYKINDDVHIPFFLIRSPYTQEGPSPCLVIVDGIFERKLLPIYNPLGITFSNVFKGTYCIVNIRGGGEYGTEWYKDGSGKNQKNSINDYLTVVKYLLKNKIASKIIAYGEGFIIGSCLKIEPKLFTAAIMVDGVYDTLKHLKLFSILPKSWTKEFLNPTEKSDGKICTELTLVHNINIDDNALYPPILFSCRSDNLRIAIEHSLKYFASLQWALKSKTKFNVTLLRILDNVGYDDKYGLLLFMEMNYARDILTFSNMAMK